MEVSASPQRMSRSHFMNWNTEELDEVVHSYPCYVQMDCCQFEMNELSCEVEESQQY